MSEFPKPELPAPEGTGANHASANKEVDLRVDKLKLENEQLRFQASWRGGRAFEFLKALTGVAAVVAALGAIAGAIFTYRSATQQLARLTASQVEERFDRDTSRLGSDSPIERLEGVSGLQLFLDSPKTSLQLASLLFLVNAAAAEKDPTVRGAILDTMATLRKYRLPERVLNKALMAACDRNRGILESLQSQFRERLKRNGKLLFNQPNNEAWLGNLNNAGLAPLRATAETIASLVRDGAHVDDLSGIYCVSCDFSAKDRRVDLSGSTFDRSYLRDANFRNAKLDKASFDGAYLSGTDFTNANLRNAKFTSPPLIDAPVQAILARKTLSGAEGPIFECADLSGADFTGSVLFGFYWTKVRGAGYFPRFYGANLRGADLKSFKIFTAFPAQLIKGERDSDTADPLRLQFRQGGGYGIRVNGWGKGEYVIREYEVGKNFKFESPIPREMWPSIYIGLNSLMSAKNLSGAQMPTGLWKFLEANRSTLSRPAISATCSSKSSP